jgi:DNA-binding response OmpR family regulator
MTRVLIVDDDADFLKLVALRVRAWGYEVTAASSAAEALRRIAVEGRPEIAILDVAMPEGSGLELLKTLRIKTTTSEVPIIFLSGLAEPADVARGKGLGAQYLTKPFDPARLLDAMNSAQTRGF